MNARRWIVLLAAVAAAGCERPLNNASCANQKRGWCSAQLGKAAWCENGGSWSRCVELREGQKCGHEQFPGECTDPGEVPGDAGEGEDAAGHDDAPTNATGDDGGGGSSESCSDGATRSCAEGGLLGNCAKGTESCNGGKWGACSVAPKPADQCDVMGDDASCNGRPNEGCPCVNGAKQPCGPAASVGICTRGMQTCAGGQWGACEGAVYARERDCTSSLDNDCDGKPDNTIDMVCKCNPVGGTQACGTHPQDGVGACHAGTQMCVAGANNASTAWGACTGSVGPAAADTCATGNDGNCNGVPNEGCQCTGGTRSCAQDGMLGNCGKGTETCSGGKWGPCSVTAKSKDSCSTSGDDANCDGVPNDHCKALGATCSAGADCQSGICVQGTCCGTTCPAGSPGSCGNDGTCDSGGACRKYSGNTCGSASCSDRNNSHEAGTCQGGSCQPGKQCDYHGCGSNNRCTTSCPSGYQDTGTACTKCGGLNQPCCVNDSCPGSAGLICDAGTCVACGAKYDGNMAQRCCTGYKCSSTSDFCKRLKDTDLGHCVSCGPNELFCCPNSICPNGNVCDSNGFCG